MPNIPDRSKEGLWSLDQSAAYLGVSRRQLQRWIANPLCNFPAKFEATPNARPVYFRIVEVKKFKKTPWNGND